MPSRLSSAGRAYLDEGDPKYRDAMENAFQLLTSTQQFASGGWGPNETFITPHRGELYASLSSTVDHFETPCGAYAATKLARYLLRTTPAPRNTAHADNLERVLYNTILAVKRPDSNGDYPYYSTYSPSAEKVFYSKKWPCCSGTLVQTVADYPLNLYFQAQSGLYVSQYASSTVDFTHAGVPVRLTQESAYPAGDATLFTVNPTRPSAFTLFVRIPAWLDRAAVLTVNGKSANIPCQPNTWVALHRTWRAGDRVSLTLPQTFRTEAIDDQHPHVVALMRGPVQYVALNPTRDLGATPLTLPAGLRQVAPQAFAENYGGQQVVFVPLHHVREESYTTYFTRA